MHTMILTCRLHQIDPDDYLVDVLQRVGGHPASRVHEHTPRLWKTLCANNPLRSALLTLIAYLFGKLVPIGTFEADLLEATSKVDSP